MWRLKFTGRDVAEGEYAVDQNDVACRLALDARDHGGSAGAAYLRSTLEKRAFPELWSLRTQL